MIKRQSQTPIYLTFETAYFLFYVQSHFFFVLGFQL